VRRTIIIPARIAAVAAIAFSLLVSAAAEDDYPRHPVRVIAASAPGGNPDVLARIQSARLSEIFNNSFVVEDVPGVGGVIAAKQTAAARPDGYTLGLNDSGSLGISIAMNPDANYTLKDFTPITALARLPTILVIRPDVPANTLTDFVALAKAKPGAMSFGSSRHRLDPSDDDDHLRESCRHCAPARALSRRHRAGQRAFDG
jgi:tripartite-type tricarboxylate transporter receptor subunit TctC